MSEIINVLAICGSLRKASYNGALLRAAAKLAPSTMAIAPSPSIAAFPLYNFDLQVSAGIPDTVLELAGAIRSADGLLICTPEYNWSIPGVLKNAIDWLSRVKDQPFAGKPVVLQSAAVGLLGGARAQYHLRQSLTALDALLFGRPEVIVSFAAQKFDKDSLELTDQPTIDMIRLQLAAFATFARKATGPARGGKE
jgi:chromate reductase, NAD(P)H dehydrogenase (quinone)